MADERTFTVSPRSTKRLRTTRAHLYRDDDGVNEHPVAPTRGNTNDDNDTDDIATNILQVVAINTEPPNEVVSKVFDNHDLLRQIFEFVGPNQFLFVAATHPLFRRIYTKQFGVLTQCNVSTMDHAEFCFRTGVTIPQHYLLPLWNLAIRHNRLPVLYHLRYMYDFSNQKDEEEESLKMAVSYGYLEILQWLMSIGGTDDEVICTIAAQNGHVHILQFLYQSTIPSIRPWPWKKNTSYSAASNGQWCTLQWLLEQRCPYCEDTLHLIRQHRHSVYQVQELYLWCIMHGIINDDDNASIASSLMIHSSSSDMMNDVHHVPANNDNNNDSYNNDTMMDHGIQLLLPAPAPAPPETNLYEEIVDLEDDDIWRLLGVGGDDEEEQQDINVANDMIPNDSAIYIEMNPIPELDFPFLFSISNHETDNNNENNNTRSVHSDAS